MTPTEDIQDFFAELKAYDERVAPPYFPGLPVKKRARGLRYLVPLAVAASVLLLLAFWPIKPAEATGVGGTETLVISLGEQGDATTETLLVGPESMYSWESPSASLIADF